MDDTAPPPDGADARPVRDLRRAREQAWSKYQAASAELAGTRIRDHISGKPRWWRRLPGARAEQAERRLAELRGELARHGVGGADHEWGVLSGGDTETFGRFGLEYTIAELAEAYGRAQAHWVRMLRDIARTATEIRPLAAGGDRAAVRDLT
ncbi:MAG: hypothetical protein J2P18_23790, partial [Nocardia sp.]|nr:hypothetical protein [Nocardia sp.]